MAFILGFIGLLLGASLGGFWGAVILCVAGALIGKWIVRNDEASKLESLAREQQSGAAAPMREPTARSPFDDFDSLRDEVLALRRRVEHLEAVAKTGVRTESEPAPVLREFARAASVAAPELKSAPVVPPVPKPEPVPPPKVEPVAAPKPEPAPVPKPQTAAPLPPAAPAAVWGAPPKAEHWTPAPQAEREPAPAREEPKAPPAEPSFIARLFSGNIVAKVGVVVLFFGVGFLLKFAYDRGLMPPELRLLAVAIGAVGLFATGWWLRDSRRLYALILQGGASGLAYLDVFFALKTYGFINPVLGFGLFAALGVVTTVAAVRQDARSLAVLGLGGAFLAPVLASTGGGNHVLLFSYYMLLNLFVLGVSWFRAWRELNLTGWLFTFVIGLFWGKVNYRPELFGSIEPFVLAFFAIYLVIPILFATRQPPQLKGLVDGTLVFGTPAAVAFMQAELVKGMPYGLAWSAAIGGGLYALLSAITWRRENMRLLAETYAALAVGLGTLAVFFAFDAYPTFAFWTIEGAAILWVGLRQDRPLARVFAILVQLAGAVLFVSEYGDVPRLHPVFNNNTYGCLLIAVASLISARLLYRYAERLRDWEGIFGPGMLLWGALWWSVGGLDALYHGVAGDVLVNAAALFFLASFAAAELVGRWMTWSALRNLAGFHPLVLATVLLAQFNHHQHPLAGLGGLAWPLGLALAFWSLRRQENDQVAAAVWPRYAALWAILGCAATWEEAWLLDHHENLYGMLFAAAAHGAAYLRFVLREKGGENSSIGSAAILLWGMVFWFANGYAYADAHLPHPELINAMLGLAAASAVLYEFFGSVLDWRGLRHATGILWIAMPIALMAQLGVSSHPFASHAWIGWIASFAVAYATLARQVRDGVAVEPALRFAVLWAVLAVIATWEEIWLLQERAYLYGMLVAVLGYAAAYLRFRLRESGDDALRIASSAMLLWAMFFWFANGFLYAEQRWDRPQLLAAMLVLAAASALTYEIAGSALGWRGLRQAATILWPAMATVLLAQIDRASHPFASVAWLAWPAALAVGYHGLYRQERDAVASFVAVKHALGLWLAVAVAGLELSWWALEWRLGGAWQTSIWGFCTAAALACSVRWGDLGRWPVAPHRDIYRGLVLGPIGAFTVAWALFANFKAPGSMAPLAYLPLLNPVDVMVGLSLGGLWAWSRWFIEPGSEGTGALRKAAGALGFIWLNGIALRSIHYWAGVPYEFNALFHSVLVQSTLSLLWTLAAMVLMFLARRRLERGLWVAGAALLGVVVAKLFLVDLASSGTVARIVSFIGVGALLLVIGYLAPVPPGEKTEPGDKRA